MIDDDGIINEFIEEAREHLSGIENDLLRIEEEGICEDKELINHVFRAIHSIKGGAGFLGLDKIKELSHSQETLLNALRNNEIEPSGPLISTLLNTIDQLNQMVENWTESNEWDISGALKELSCFLEGQAQVENTQKVPEKEPEPETNANLETIIAPDGNLISHVEHKVVEDCELKGLYLYAIEVRIDEDLTAHDKELGDFLKDCKNTGQIIATDIDCDFILSNTTSAASLPVLFHMIYATVLDPSVIDSLLPVAQERLKSLTVDDFINTAPPAEKKEDEPPPKAAKKAPAKDTSLRVNLNTLDTLMSLTSELVLARNQLTKKIRDTGNRNLESLAQNLDSITSSLQLTVMSTRMQPIGKVFNRFKRVVRDLANMLGKQIDLVIEGETVELDKTIIETISDPLTHLVRNACDHGLEPPDVRQKTGKSDAGTLCLRAFHEAGQVIIEIIDDGRGIDAKFIKKKALQTGNFEPEVLEAMSEKELQKLIFKPGFSTAQEVTEVSGRGVGMDVVHTNFAKLGGIIDVDSTVGKGSTIRVKLPLTLAIIPSLLVQVQSEVFAIPQANLVELVSVPPEQLKDSVHELANYEVLRLRGSLLPLVDPADVLQLDQRYRNPTSGEVHPERRKKGLDRRSKALFSNHEPTDDTEGPHTRQKRDRRRQPQSYLNVVVVASGNSRYGLIVDEFLDSEEIVVKPLDSFLKFCRCYAGATIQGNGRVALILDIMGISEQIQLSDTSEQLAAAEAQDQLDSQYGERQEVLIFSNSGEEHFAVPLSMVARIEIVRQGDIQFTADRPNIQYRNGSLPLISIEEVVNVPPRQDGELINILVFAINGREIGLMCSTIHDVHAIEGHIDEATFRQPGILGSAIVENKTTLIIDLYGIITMLYPDWMEEIRYKSEERPTVLLVEDSKFYRTHIKEFLEENGCDVTACEDGVEGFQALESDPDGFAMVFTDIEMPNMNGIEMTEKIRRESRFQNLPIVAVTSLAGTECEARGLEAGISEYLIKLNKEDISKCLQKYLNQ